MTIRIRIVFLAWLVCLQSLSAQTHEKPEIVLNAIGGGWGANIIALSPDNRFVAVGYYDGLIKIRDARDQSLIRAIKVGGPVEKILFSPSADSLLVETQNEGDAALLYLFDWSKEQYPTGHSLGKYRLCAWTPEKQAIYLLREDQKNNFFGSNYSYQIERRDYGLKSVGKPLSLVVKHQLNEKGDIIQDDLESIAQAHQKPLLAMGFQHGWLVVANLDSMKIVLKQRVAPEGINDLNFSINDRYLCAEVHAYYLSLRAPTAMVWSVDDNFKSVYQGQPFGPKGEIYQLFAFEYNEFLLVEGADSLGAKSKILIMDLHSGELKSMVHQNWGNRVTNSNEQIQYNINGPVFPADTFELIAYGSESSGQRIKSAFHPVKKSVLLGCLANEWPLDTLPFLTEYPKNDPVQMFGFDGKWICEKADATKLSFAKPDFSSFRTGKPTLEKVTLCFKLLDPKGQVLRFDSLEIVKVSQDEISVEDAVTLSPNLRGLVSKISKTEWVYYDLIPPKSGKNSNWTLKERKTFSFPEQKVLDIRFSPQGGLLVVMTYPEDSKDWSLPFVEVFSTHSLKRVQSFQSAFLEPRDRLLFDGSGLTAISPNLVYCSAARPNDQQSNWQRARFYDLKTGWQLADFNTHGKIGAIAAHPERPLFAIGVNTAKGCQVFLYDAERHMCLDTFQMDIYSINIISIDFCPWSTLLLVSSGDYVELWNWETGQKIVTLFADGNQNDAYAGSVLFTPEGYYATLGLINEKLIRYRFGQKTYPLQSFDATYNAPDFVLKKIGVASPSQIEQYAAAREKRMKKLRESQNNPKYSAPTLRVLNEDQILPYTRRNLLPLSISMRDDSLPLKVLKVWVNNVPMNGLKGFSLADKGVFHEMTIEVPLDTGQNLIELAVANQQGNISVRTQIRVHGEISLPPDLYVALMGVSQYENYDSLPGPVRDVEYLSQVFRQQRKGTDSKGLRVFDKIHLKTLTNQGVNAQNITDIEAFCAQARPQDIVLVYYAGHGLADKIGGYYLATHDMDFSRPAAKGISLDSVMAWLEAIPSRKKVLAINACNSGEYDQDQAVFEAMRNIFPFFQPSKGTHIIASSSAQQVSFAAGGGKQGGLTSFGYALADFFKHQRQAYFGYNEIDRQAYSVYGSTRLTVSDLANYTRRKVIELTDGAQVPEYRQSNFRSDFTIWSTYFDGD